ncbi:MAG: hypothetical protein KJ571_14160 [Bacteroidetes bacterium]|nr:hypothetical protein [Bacteroidota bacterium]
MKTLLLIIYFFSIPLLAQKVSVAENIAVTTESEGSFFYPTVSPDGSAILFSEQNQKGLWLKNIKTGKLEKITDAAGAGYDAGFSDNGSEIFYRSDKFVSGRRMSSLVSHNLLTGKETKIENDVRDLKLSRTTRWKCYLYMKENTVKPIPGISSLNKKQASLLSVFIENSNIVLYKNGSKTNIQPLGKGNYIWPSISPDGTKLLFTFAGKGTYVSDLNGKIIAELGRANYPSWSPDGSWIVFMDDKDDGRVLTTSTIGIVKFDGSERYTLTENDKNISIYPKWGNTRNEIYYNTSSGQVRKLNLKYE